MGKLFIPVIEGTTRPKRKSIQVANLITKIGNDLNGVKAELVDPANLALPDDGRSPESRDPKYTEITRKADGFFIVVPEYNHSFPGSLKRLLDSELENYYHKPVALAGVSSGEFGGARAIQALVPVLRKLGLIIVSTDVYFPSVEKLFDKEGKLLDEKYVERVKKSYEELRWLAKTLRLGQENLESKF